MILFLLSSNHFDDYILYLNANYIKNLIFQRHKFPGINRGIFTYIFYMYILHVYFTCLLYSYS